MQQTLCSCIIWRHLQWTGCGPDSSSCCLLTHICWTEIVLLVVMSSHVLLAPRQCNVGTQVLMEVNITLQGRFGRGFMKCSGTPCSGRRAGGDTLDIQSSRCQGRRPDHQRLTALLWGGGRRREGHGRSVSCSRPRVTGHSFPSGRPTSSRAAVVVKL